ncbi:ATP-binding protein, partial [Candidatus Woesearchaeota archaeon]|nr:ATP-binding protein [Candidatus Woesearchaeota archaeon]
MPAEKQFNTAGPCEADDHYLIDPLERIDYRSLLALIDSKRYFVLHAPRQTGKTTSLATLVHYLNQTGQYRAVYANIEAAQTARHNVASGMATVASVLAREVEHYTGESCVAEWFERHLQHEPNDLITALLTAWSQADSRPAVLMLDEVDALVGDTLISLLRQLRSGYMTRPARFPQSVILCGVRDIRDYRIHSSKNEIITGGSAFNVKAKSLRVGNFIREEVEALWLQHTESTGQTFDPAIFPELWEDSRGQPWLVNALGHELTYENALIRRDRTRPITLDDYRAARESLIQSRATHLDQLVDKLREERVQAVIGPLL